MAGRGLEGVWETFGGRLGKIHAAGRVHAVRRRVKRRAAPCAPCAVCKAPCASPCDAVWRRAAPCAPCAPPCDAVWRRAAPCGAVWRRVRRVRPYIGYVGVYMLAYMQAYTQAFISVYTHPYEVEWNYINVY